MSVTHCPHCGADVEPFDLHDCRAPHPVEHLDPEPEPCHDCGGRGYTSYNLYDGGGCPRCGGRGTERGF